MRRKLAQPMQEGNNRPQWSARYLLIAASPGTISTGNESEQLSATMKRSTCLFSQSNYVCSGCLPWDSPASLCRSRPFCPVARNQSRQRQWWDGALDPFHCSLPALKALLHLGVAEVSGRARPRIYAYSYDCNFAQELFRHLYQATLEVHSHGQHNWYRSPTVVFFST